MDARLNLLGSPVVAKLLKHIVAAGKVVPDSNLPAVRGCHGPLPRAGRPPPAGDPPGACPYDQAGAMSDRSEVS
jgi:hypothetical protein